MNQFQQELQALSLNDYQSGNVVYWDQQNQYPYYYIEDPLVAVVVVVAVAVVVVVAVVRSLWWIPLFWLLRLFWLF